MVRHRVGAAVDRFLDATPGWVGPLAVAGTFVLAVRLLGSSTRSLAPELALLLRRVVVGDAAALGVGWLAAYLLGNGSLVAAVAVSLFASGVVTPANLYLLVAGSRLGAAGVVLFVGALDFLQERHLTLSKSLELGVLTAVVTLTVALPATAVGYPLVPLVARRVGVPTATATEPVVGAVATAGALSTRVGSVLAFVAAVALFVAALDLFDRVLDRVDTGRLRARYVDRLENRWVAFGLGVVVTGLTTSVAFSLGAVVPLYNRGYVDRSHVVPYVLGANVGTFADTVLVAVVLGSPVAALLVVLYASVTAVAATLAVAAFDGYGHGVELVVERVFAGRLALGLTLAALTAVPLALVLVPLLRSL